jgi:hypothetical protein
MFVVDRDKMVGHGPRIELYIDVVGHGQIVCDSKVWQGVRKFLQSCSSTREFAICR